MALNWGKYTVVSALILNDKGLERALNCAVPHVSMSVSVSDTHSRKNARRPAVEALESMTRLIHEAITAGLDVRAGLRPVEHNGLVDRDAPFGGPHRTGDGERHREHDDERNETLNSHRNPHRAHGPRFAHLGK